MKLFRIVIITFFLQGCLSSLIIGSAAVVTKSLIDPRTIGQQIDDNTLEILINSKINKDKKISKNSRINLVSYSGNILLFGQSIDLYSIKRAEILTNNVFGVKKVFNEIRHIQSINIYSILKDILVTAKIKLQIFINNFLSSSNIKVITENGEVFVLGILSEKEGKLVSKIISEINGVKRVTTIFSYLD